ncbi:MAG TPA: hypothetical protein VEC18_04885 [Myxococcota bacterium]|nr:hypothetical protein [Myxococcota bacterium]
MDVVLISYLVAVAVSFAVGAPTLVRALRARDTPLVLLGAAVSFDAFEWLVWTLACYTPAYETPLGFALSVACRLGIIASVLCLILFTRSVFRPHSAAAQAFALLIAGALVLSVVGSGALGDWEGVRNDHVWVWLEQIALMTGYGWTSLEAGRAYRLTKRRARYGLGDAMTAHRQLLWSIYAGMFFLAEGVYVITLAFYGMLSDLDSLNAAITVFAQLALGAAVFAPRWYVRRVCSGSEAARTGQ